MNLQQLINKSYYGSIGYISDENDVHLLKSYLQYNYPVLKEYKGHIFSFTYKELNVDELENTIYSLFPDAKVIILPENRGHNFGTADLDNSLFDYCKENKIEWLCKSSNDVVLKEQILSKEIEEADFYYLNGIGYGGMVKYNFDNQRIINEDFYPQTNFYFINVSKTDYLNNSDYIDETYNYVQTLENYNGKIWEHIEGWSCEDFLKNCVHRNNLSKYHLVSLEKYIILLEYIKSYQIHDCSHKNIMIEGICHLQHPNNPSIEI